MIQKDMRISILGGILILCGAARLFLNGESQPPVPPSPKNILEASRYNFSAGGQSLIVMCNGQVLHESYANGGGAQTYQLLASATKGFVGMIGAMAADDGLIEFDEPVSHVLWEWQDDPWKSRITYRHLLTMTSGLEELHDVTSWEDFLEAKALHPPGTVFNYAADPNIFGLALQRKLGGESVESYMNRRLFQPLGIAIRWAGGFEDGNPQLSGGAYAKPGEWIKFGEFVRLMFAGAWPGPRLVSAENFQEVFRGTSANPAYGFYWWLKEPISESLVDEILQIERHIWAIIQAPWVPDDFVMAAGAYEQRLYVIPSRGVVVVRNGPKSAAGQFLDIYFLLLLLGGFPL